MSVEIHKTYPIGMLEDGDTYCVAVHERGYADWFKLHAEWDLFDELDQPTLRDEEIQGISGLVYEDWEELPLHSEEFWA